VAFPPHNGHAPAGDPALVLAELMPEAGLAAALQLIAAVNRIARGPHAQQ
jgi:hypothetical protein